MGDARVGVRVGQAFVLVKCYDVRANGREGLRIAETRTLESYAGSLYTRDILSILAPGINGLAGCGCVHCIQGVYLKREVLDSSLQARDLHVAIIVRSTKPSTRMAITTATTAMIHNKRSTEVEATFVVLRNL